MGIPRQNKLDYFLLLFILTALSLFLYRHTISWFPSHIHAWTQSDRYALALGFLDNNFNFFRPQTFNLTTLHGITGVDFPIHEYIVACLMKLLGTESPYVFRSYTLIYSLGGLFFLYRLTEELIQPVMVRISIVIFVFTCPVIAYYQNGFLPSTTSFANVLIGYFYYFKFVKNKNPAYFYVAIGFLCLAALCRPPFNIFLFAILIREVIRGMNKKTFVRYKIVGFLSAYVLIFFAYWYKSHLNANYGSQFLTELLPAKSLQELISLFSSVVDRWSMQLFTIYHYVLLFVALGVFILHRKRLLKLDGVRKEILIQGVLILGGAFLYFIFMAKQYVDHEYYFIDSFYPGIILFFILGISLIKFDNKDSVIVCSLFFPALVLGATLESNEILKIKYAETLWDRGEVTRKNFIGSAEILDELEVSRSDTILVIDAYSTNAPLILMDRKGYTGLRTAPEEINKLLQLDYNYIVIQDIFFPSDVVYNYPEIINKMVRVGGNGKISVFKHSEEDTIGSIKNLLGIVEPSLSSYNNYDSEVDNLLWKTHAELSDLEFISPPNSAFINSTVVYGPGIEIKNNSLDFNKILFEGHFKIKEDIDKIYVVCSITEEGEDLYYWNFPIKNIGIEKWRNYQCLFSLPFTPKPSQTLKCYIWNPGKENVFIDDIELTLYQK